MVGCEAWFTLDWQPSSASPLRLPDVPDCISLVRLDIGVRINHFISKRGSSFVHHWFPHLLPPAVTLHCSAFLSLSAAPMVTGLDLTLHSNPTPAGQPIDQHQLCQLPFPPHLAIRWQQHHGPIPGEPDPGLGAHDRLLNHQQQVSQPGAPHKCGCMCMNPGAR